LGKVSHGVGLPTRLGKKQLRTKPYVKEESMRSETRWIPPIVLVLVALCWADRPSSALPPISFAGGRPARITEQPLIPLPEDAPLSPAKADSIILAHSTGERFPETRYDVFDVDLDDDGKPEQIAQVAWITSTGSFALCWWGVYAGGKIDQVILWNYNEMKDRISDMQAPASFRDSADSLSFHQAVPEFYPALDIVKYGDLTGDGKPEIVVWMVGRFATQTRWTGVVCPVILSPTPNAYKEIYRGRTAFVDCKTVGPGKRNSRSRFYRISSRLKKSGGPLDLLLEPRTVKASNDSLCKAVWLDERMLPNNPDEWMPTKPIGASVPVSKDWMITRWDGDHFGGLQFVRDVKLD
jgi:hypothetical protein